MMTQSQRRISHFLALVMLAAAPWTQAQAPATAGMKLPVYDVVSIKPNKTGTGSFGWDQDDGNLSASNLTLKQLINIAYNLKEGQLVGLPAWGTSARFNMEAKVLEPDKEVFKKLSDVQSAAMLQPILTERFGLKSHGETKELPVYELVVAKGGPRFKASAAAASSGSMNIRNRELTATGIPMDALASNLSDQFRRLVVDRTGLTGKYDFTLTWSPDDAALGEPANAPPVLLTALQEQLGLKLVASKATVKTFVIDHVELPSEN